MSKTELIITGAAGRMGRTLLSLIESDPDCLLKGVLEHPDRIQALEGRDCPKGADPREVLGQAPGAVVIDFSLPDGTLKIVEAALETKNPMVIGTTGFSDDQTRVLQEASAQVPIFWAPNMSVGISVLLEILPDLTRMLGPEYDVELSEIHHKHKKDAPSGTAVKLANTLTRAKGWDEKEAQRFCRQGIIGERPDREIGVQTLRGGDVVGEHTVYFLGPGERIDITHRAHSRETFAKGALRAAKWLAQKQAGKLYAMADLFHEH